MLVLGACSVIRHSSFYIWLDLVGFTWIRLDLLGFPWITHDLSRCGNHPQGLVFLGISLVILGHRSSERRRLVAVRQYFFWFKNLGISWGLMVFTAAKTAPAT